MELFTVHLAIISGVLQPDEDHSGEELLLSLDDVFLLSRTCGTETDHWS